MQFKKGEYKMSKKLEFTVDSFGSDCPQNWQEIVDFLNTKITEEMDRDDLEKIWSNYCGGKYTDAPEAERRAENENNRKY